MQVRHLILMAGVIAMVACSDDGNQEPGDGDPVGDVLVGNNFFDPSEVDIEAGATVTWAWDSDGVEHNVTFEEGTNSPTQGSGTFERTFPAAGDFPYLCTIHGESMNGVVHVGEAPAPDDGGSGGGPGDPDY
jgi:plastocyanin